MLTFSFCVFGEENCSTLDLHANNDSPFNKIPTYDQDGSGLCYAFATSQLIDYYRIKNNDHSYDLTNPVYAAWSTYYENSKERESLSGGFSNDIITALKANGVCSNREIKNRLALLAKTNKLTEAQILHFIETMFKHYHGVYGAENLETLKAAKKEMLTKNRLTCEQIEELTNVFVANHYLGIAPTVILSEIFKDCTKRKINLPSFTRTHFGTDATVKSMIEESLNKELPAQVDLCSKIFRVPPNENYRGLSPTLFLPRTSNLTNKNDCGLHAVLVTGRTKINGQCHYQIRNSYGSFWYPPHATSCSCFLKNGAYKTFCQKGEGLEYVACWFKEQDIVPNVGGVGVFN